MCVCVSLAECVSRALHVSPSVLPAGTANNVEEALEIAAQIGRYPLIIRPAFTCGGAGGGIAYNVDEFKTMVQEGIDASMTNQVCVCVCVCARWGRASDFKVP